LKIVSILGSPHGGSGNTARLLGLVLDAAETHGARTEIVYLPGHNVLPCKGCDICHKRGKCIQKDEFEAIKEKIKKADGLILASPNYIFNVSAQIKAFMDRCCGIVHCMGFEGKYGASVITSGGGDEAPIAEYMDHFMVATGIRPIGSVWATMSMFAGDAFPQEIQEKARLLGENLVRSWEGRETKPEVEKALSQFKDRMRNLVGNMKDEWTFEHDYWVKNHDLQ
jgi:multimeric flavodoxin WrbA